MKSVILRISFRRRIMNKYDGHHSPITDYAECKIPPLKVDDFRGKYREVKKDQNKHKVKKHKIFTPSRAFH